MERVVLPGVEASLRVGHHAVQGHAGAGPGGESDILLFPRVMVASDGLQA